MHATLTINLPLEAVSLATGVARDLQRAIGLDEPWTSVRAYLDVDARLAQIAAVERTLGNDLRPCRILEVGSGMGMLVAVATKLGLDIVGCEPAANAYAHLGAARDALMRANGVSPRSIVACAAEQLPWAEDTFDVVLSFQVLEHVVAPAKMLAEAMRVLKPGGRLYCEAPSHRSLIEGHFGIAWLPVLANSKPLAKAYVAMQGRNPAFLDELNLMTPTRVRRWMSPLACTYAVGCRSRQDGASPSTEGVQVASDDAGVPLATRFTGVAALVRRATRHQRIRPWVERLGLSEHIVLTATK